MKNYWIITVANPWCDMLLRGLKTMELRKRVPNLQAGDIIFVCRKGGGTVIVGSFELTCLNNYPLFVLTLPRYVELHRVKEYDIREYANGASCLFGLTLSRIRFEGGMKVEDFGYVRNPQNFYRIKPDFWHNIPAEIMTRNLPK